MWLEPIQVECHAGYKADEEPRRFRRGARWIAVVEIVDRWHQVQSLPEWPRADYFKVLGDDGQTHMLKYDIESEAWFLGLRSAPPTAP